MPAAKWFNPDGSRMTCSVEDCERPVKDSGLCDPHAQRMRKHGTTQKPVGGLWNNPDGSRMICRLEGCEYPVKALALCRTHWAQTRRGLEPHVTVVETRYCSVAGCEKKHIANGFCSMHYQRNRFWGEPGEAEMRHIQNRWVNADGSRTICDVKNCELDVLAHGICSKHYNYFRYYSLNIEQLDHLFTENNYMCSNSSCRSTEKLDLDHDHSCCPPHLYKEQKFKSCGNCIRGWLCRRCNSVLGFVKDDSELLKGLIAHLEGGSRNDDTCGR